MQRYDAVIIGSGPAGLAAAINLKIRNKTFRLFGQKALSRKLLTASRIDNYLGLPGISGLDLSERFQAHLDQMDIPVHPQQIQMIYPMGDFFSLAGGADTFEATTVILAPGIQHAKPLPGEEELLGRGVGYCATCDAPLFKGKTVAVLGYTDEAAHEAQYVAELAAQVYYVPMSETVLLPDPPVEILRGRVTAIEGDQQVRSLAMKDRALAVDGVFVLREAVAPASLLPGIAVEDGYIAVDSSMRTNLPGCFAAGDCTGKPHQFMRAAGQGQTAALSAVAYIDNLKKAQRA